MLDGSKRATASAPWDCGAEGEPIPEVGTLDILLDSAGLPRAVLMTTEVRVVPFDRVDEGHARAEGEGDRSLAYWRETHRRFFAEHAVHGRGFAPDMRVVLERFEVPYQS